jgi:MOSC domain-containing protein
VRRLGAGPFGTVSQMITVARLSTSPVKSLGLSHPEHVRIEPWGVPGNRRFLLLTGQQQLVAAKFHGELMQVRSNYDEGRDQLSLRFPDGRVVEDRVQLDGTPIDLEMWGRALKARYVHGPWSDALSDFVGAPMRLVKTEGPGDGNDEYPVSLVSLASVAELTTQGGREELMDPGRFRMLLELEGCSSHEEDGWLGRNVRVGEAVIRVAEHDARCSITTMNPTTGEVDFPTLKTIARYRGAQGGAIPFGMYATVSQPGAVRVGDQVEPLQ